MKEYEVHEKFWDGVMYPVSKEKNKVVIAMSGSEGGLKHAEMLAHFLQDNNIPALALGLFKTKNSQRNLDRIPLERIYDVIIWLQRNGYKNIAVEGVSKGAEYALAAAIAFPELSCVIVKTPSWFYSEGIISQKPSGTSCWSYLGKELPFTPYKTRKFGMGKMLWKAKEFNILEVNTSKTIVPESIIPVEKIKAPILMFSTSADTIWPSKESCEKLEDRLNKKNFSYPHRHICFDHMSHMMTEYCNPQIRWFMKSERQYPEECAKERKEMGNICVDWIKNIWNPADKKETATQ
ncbi:acyl-CoA thioester hydrolase/BAAT C-terminal domain-containing protein [Caproicibacterium sp. NSD3]